MLAHKYKEGKTKFDSLLLLTANRLSCISRYILTTKECIVKRKLS